MKRKGKRKVGGDTSQAQKASEPQAQNAAQKSREEFQVEFQFFDPEEDDFHSVRDLLCGGTLGFADLDFSGLANSIVDQVNIGTMVKSGAEEATDAKAAKAGDEDEDEVTLCGMLTILNLRQFRDEAWCKSLLGLLESKAKEKQFLNWTKGEVNQVGLVISERFVNLPLELIPAMHNVILEDIQWSCTTEYCPAEECTKWGRKKIR